MRVNWQLKFFRQITASDKKRVGATLRNNGSESEPDEVLTRANFPIGHGLFDNIEQVAANPRRKESIQSVD